jgi:4-hydroxy-tetrahydrodipicolinate reductase
MIRMAVFGGGRMAARVHDAAVRDDDVQLVCVVSRSCPDWVKPQKRVSSLGDCPSDIDCLVDFTLPGGTLEAAAWCAGHGVAMVSGTTGLSDSEFSGLDAAAQAVPVLWAPNLSPGVNLMLALAAEAAVALGPEVPVAIHDVHHVHKKDAPSGTALALAQEVAAARCQEPGEVIDIAEMPVMEPPPAGRICCSSSREGEVIGVHELRFYLGGEVIKLSHVATNRGIYARGAIEAGKWLVNQPPGRYTAKDWLGRAVSV